MKRFLFILMTLAALAAGTDAYAQRLQNGNYSTIGYIKSDGTVQNGNYSTIGYIKSDGTVQNSNYSTIGYIKSDGRVQNSNYSTIGYADTGIRKEWVAWFYFFREK